ncbi:MAG: hypothetical protein KDB11_10425, partial [Planctomycetales bacterium]|nr:hypothetical protein [Planctomycetales bacterium]
MPRKRQSQQHKLLPARSHLRRQKVRARRLLFEQFEDRRVLAAVSWDGGGGDLLWGNPLNWSGDQLPGADDDVTVDAPGDATIVHDKSESSVRSLALHDHLHLRLGSSVTTASLAIAANNSIWAEGSGTEFHATGESNIDGADLYATAGGLVDIAATGTVTNTSGDGIWQAIGVDSELRFPNLTTVSNGTSANQDFYIQALQGGRIDLPSVTEIIDPNSGTQDGRSIRLKADGANSVIDLSSLQNFVDYHAWELHEEQSYRDDGEYSWLETVQNGTIELGALTSVRGVYIPI